MSKEKVDKLYECYRSLAGDKTNEITYKLCEVIVRDLSEDQYNYLIEYMSHELYPPIYETIENALAEVVMGTMTDIFSVESETAYGFPTESEKYGKN